MIAEPLNWVSTFVTEPERSLLYCKFGPRRSRLSQATLAGSISPFDELSVAAHPNPNHTRPRVATLCSVRAAFYRHAAAGQCD